MKKLHIVEMKMFRLTAGVTKLDKLRNKYIRLSLVIRYIERRDKNDTANLIKVGKRAKKTKKQMKEDCDKESKEITATQ